MEGPSFSLSGRVALVTGAGRGIGLAIARALASAGCAVAIQDIELDVAAAEVEKLRAAGGKAVALSGDIGDLALPKRLVAQTRMELGGLHILINNAAIQSSKPWTRYTPEEIEREWRVNMVAPILLCQQAMPIFEEQRWGRIVNIGSIQGKWGNPEMVPYAASKAGLENITRSLAKDLAPEGITVNLIAPGYFNTWRNRDDFRTPTELAERVKKWVPMGRIGEPADAAGLALVLCSDAGAYITGQTIYVDGGMSLR